jgi:hypothetical protein
MEIYSMEMDLGQLTIEVSIKNTSPIIRFGNFISGQKMENEFNVYLTAKDKNGRRLWRTPMTDNDGQPKTYTSIESAIDDATIKFLKRVRD